MDPLTLLKLLKTGKAIWDVGSSIFNTTKKTPKFKPSPEQLRYMKNIKKQMAEGVYGKEGLVKAKNQASRTLAQEEGVRASEIQGNAIRTGVGGRLGSQGYLNRLKSMIAGQKINATNKIDEINNASKFQATQAYGNQANTMANADYSSKLSAYKDGMTNNMNLQNTISSLLGEQINQNTPLSDLQIAELLKYIDIDTLVAAGLIEVGG